MRFKKVRGRGDNNSYQCYAEVNRWCFEAGKMKATEKRLARIDEPHEKESRGHPGCWGVFFVGGYANEGASYLIKITDKIKKLAKEYRNNE